MKHGKHSDLMVGFTVLPPERRTLRSSRRSRHLAATALLASALVLTACGSSATTGAERGNDADIVFLTSMQSDHDQAVQMSDMVLLAHPPAQVAAIAKQIKAAQSPEIEQMDAMLGDLGQQPRDGTPGAMRGGGMSGGGMADHGGMMSDHGMAALDRATGTEACGLYLEGMLRHHEGAIEASDAEIEDGSYEPALELARTIRQAQTAETTTLQALLQAL